MSNSNELGRPHLVKPDGASEQNWVDARLIGYVTYDGGSDELKVYHVPGTASGSDVQVLFIQTYTNVTGANADKFISEINLNISSIS